ncbi:MAG: LLM class flavin-dependent oxidoreductase [Rhodopila sp.]
MTERLALAIHPATGWHSGDIGTISREAEDASFEAIFTTDFRNDGLATALFMGQQTSRIKVGTFVANIYLRNAYVCAQAAAFITEVTSGRMVLGLGVSHPVVNSQLGIDMGVPLPTLRTYVTDVQNWLQRKGPEFLVSVRPLDASVPIYVAALSSKSVEQAGEIADGIMPIFWPPSRVTQSQTWIQRGRSKAPERGKLEIALGLPAFVGEDLNAMRDIARREVGFYAAVPTYQRVFRLAGFQDEADKAERGATVDAISNRLLDAFCLVGPRERCLEQLAAFREAGVDLPILYSPIDMQAAQAVVKAFRQ